LLGLAVPLLLSLLLAARSAFRESCTVDEFGNLPLTVAYWRADALHVDRGNPPLTRWIQGIPLLGAAPDLGCSAAELDSIRTSWDLGYRFEAVHRRDYHALLTRARWGAIALLLATVAGVWALARDVAGPGPAFAAALLAAACPNLLAHGRLATPDVGVACFTVWAVRAALRARRDRTARAAALAGLLVGAASLAKFSGLLLAPVLGLAVAAGPGARRGARLGAFLLACLLPMYAAYGSLVPGTLRGWPTPLPAGVTQGIEAQLQEAPYPAYLLGELREGGGWVHYHLVALLVKTPLPALALFALAIGRVLRGRRRPFALPLLTACLFFAAFGAATRKNVGLRYVLPVLPLLHVVAAAAFLPASPASTRLSRSFLRVAPPALAALAVVAGVAASAAPLASFNGTERLLGGKRAVLVDSNLDWGQALPDLRAWQKRAGASVVQLAYFGRVDPSIYGVNWRTLPSTPVRGPVAISATFAVGRPYAVLMKERSGEAPVRAWSTVDTWEWLRDLPPDEELGGGAMLVWKDVGAALDARRRGGGR
jgi:4-amino-4-deoxy-L-arabinose transferase-like glycosyltransferase